MKENKLTYQIIKNVLQTLIIGICFGTVYLIGILIIPAVAFEWYLFVLRIVVPVLLAYGFCFVCNRKVFRFNIKNIANRHSIYRFLNRLVIVLCFLVVGFILGNLRPNAYGELRGQVISILCNFLFYAVISVFILVFSVTEFLFVKAKS